MALVWIVVGTGLAFRQPQYAPVCLAMAGHWLLPRRFSLPVAAVASVVSGVWVIVAELVDHSAAGARSFHLAIGAALLIVPVVALARRRTA